MAFTLDAARCNGPVYLLAFSTSCAPHASRVGSLCRLRSVGQHAAKGSHSEPAKVKIKDCVACRKIINDIPCRKSPAHGRLGGGNGRGVSCSGYVIFLWASTVGQSRPELHAAKYLMTMLLKMVRDRTRPAATCRVSTEPHGNPAAGLSCDVWGFKVGGIIHIASGDFRIDLIRAPHLTISRGITGSERVETLYPGRV